MAFGFASLAAPPPAPAYSTAPEINYPDGSLVLSGANSPASMARLIGYLSPPTGNNPISGNDTINWTDARRVVTGATTITGSSLTPGGINLTLAAAQGKGSLQQSSPDIAPTVPLRATRVPWLVAILIIGALYFLYKSLSR